MAPGRLVLINGAPGSGKSTMARMLCLAHPLALSLDIDVVRGQLGDWLSMPEESGRAARALALVMAEGHLTSGFDVVVPQFLAKMEFLDQLDSLAARLAVRFNEVVLFSSAQEAAARFAERSSAPTDSTHLDAVALQEASGAQVADQYRQVMALAEQRPGSVFVESIPGQPEATAAVLRQVLQW